jgi:hypothetical protein
MASRRPGGHPAGPVAEPGVGDRDTHHHRPWRRLAPAGHWGRGAGPPKGRAGFVTVPQDFLGTLSGARRPTTAWCRSRSRACLPRPGWSQSTPAENGAPPPRSPTEPSVPVWLQLALCVALIGFAAVRLTRYGNAIWERSGGTSSPLAKSEPQDSPPRDRRGERRRPGPLGRSSTHEMGRAPREQDRRRFGSSRCSMPRPTSGLKRTFDSSRACPPSRGGHARTR